MIRRLSRRPAPLSRLIAGTMRGRHPAWEPQQVFDSHVHRDVRGGGFRAAVFGISDGLVSNVSLVLGTAGAHPGAGIVRLAGLAGMFGGSFSMAAGEYISMRTQREVFEHELRVEREEIAAKPDFERRELEAIYRQRGIDADTASRIAEQLMADPETALETHAREELGLDPNALGSPIQAALASFITFAVGAIVPLIAFLGGSSGTTAVEWAIAFTGATALAIGGALSRITKRPPIFSALRSLFVCAIAGSVTYGIGAAVGVTVG